MAAKLVSEEELILNGLYLFPWPSWITKTKFMVTVKGIITLCWFAFSVFPEAKRAAYCDCHFTNHRPIYTVYAVKFLFKVSWRVRNWRLLCLRHHSLLLSKYSGDIKCPLLSVSRALYALRTFLSSSKIALFFQRYVALHQTRLLMIKHFSGFYSTVR